MQFPREIINRYNNFSNEQRQQICEKLGLRSSTMYQADFFGAIAKSFYHKYPKIFQAADITQQLVKKLEDLESDFKCPFETIKLQQQ
jgi:hypothetical protein